MKQQQKFVLMRRYTAEWLNTQRKRKKKLQKSSRFTRVKTNGGKGEEELALWLTGTTRRWWLSTWNFTFQGYSDDRQTVCLFIVVDNSHSEKKKKMKCKNDEEEEEDKKPKKIK